MPENILIVDDEETIREIISLKLAENGYLCATAGSAEDALALMKGKDFNLIISDIRMPGMSGMELLKIVKSDYPNVEAVIMVTGITDMTTAVEALKIGAYDYITKPFNLDEVAINVKRALERRRLILENRDYQHNLEEKVQEQTKEIREHLVKEQDYSQKLREALNEIETTYHSTLEALSMALDYRDNETEGHSQRVTAYSLAIARELGIKPDEIKIVQMGALLHDVGKIGVLDAILKKPAKLDNVEW